MWQRRGHVSSYPESNEGLRLDPLFRDAKVLKGRGRFGPRMIAGVP